MKKKRSLPRSAFATASARVVRWAAELLPGARRASVVATQVGGAQGTVIESVIAVLPRDGSLPVYYRIAKPLMELQREDVAELAAPRET